MNLSEAYARCGVTLEPTGSHLFGVCPFHNDSKSSFVVYEDGSYHCFGCSAHGTYKDFAGHFGGDSREYFFGRGLDTIQEKYLLDLDNQRRQMDTELYAKLIEAPYQLRYDSWLRFDNLWLQIKLMQEEDDTPFIKLLMQIKSEFRKINSLIKKGLTYDSGES